MSDNISRILSMVERGNITVEEAERLIKAANDADRRRDSSTNADQPKSAARTAEDEFGGHTERAVTDLWDPFSPFSNPIADLGDLPRILKRIRNRVRRAHVRRYWLSYFRLNRWYEHRRSQRRTSMTAYERVRFVVMAAPAYPEFIIQRETNLGELLGADQIGWDLLRFGLEEEFGVSLSSADVRAFRTVQQIVDAVEPVTGESKPTPESADHDGESNGQVDESGSVGTESSFHSAEPSSKDIDSEASSDSVTASANNEGGGVEGPLPPKKDARRGRSAGASDSN